MTDAEIIKAANCCFKQHSCAECPLDFGENDANCTRTLRELIIDLITRQSAEIERLRAVVEETEAAYYAQIDKIRHLMENGVTVQEWINSEEILPQFPCLALDVNGNSVFIPDGILTIKDNHGEWCINASLAKEVRLVDGTKIDVLLWENRIAYWMPLPEPPKGE